MTKSGVSAQNPSVGDMAILRPLPVSLRQWCAARPYFLREEVIRDDYGRSHKYGTGNHCHVRQADSLPTHNSIRNSWQKLDHHRDARNHSDNGKGRMNMHEAKSNHLRSARPRPHRLFPHDASCKQRGYGEGEEPPHLESAGQYGLRLHSWHSLWICRLAKVNWRKQATARFDRWSLSVTAILRQRRSPCSNR